MSLIENEQTKLTATYLNGVAIAIFAIGALAPIISLSDRGLQGWTLGQTAVILICLIISLILHLGARRSLRELRP